MAEHLSLPVRVEAVAGSDATTRWVGVRRSRTEELAWPRMVRVYEAL